MAASTRAPGASRHWAQIDEVSFVAGIRLLFWLCRLFGRWPFRAVLFPVLLWYVIAKPWARTASSQFLRRVATLDGGSTVDSSFIGVLRHFAAFGECILDKLLLWSDLFHADSVRVYGVGQIAEQIRAERGALFICCHLGNLELCRVMSKRHPGLKLTVLLHTKNAARFNRLLARINPDSQLDILQVTELTPVTAALLKERVGRGEFVAIAGDRIPVSEDPRITRVPFLGEPAPFPIGPYVLANLLQCPVYLLFSLRIRDGWEIHLEEFCDQVRLPRQERDAALASLTSAYAARLEDYCRQAPLQWFNFYDFWQIDRPDEKQHAQQRQ
jgi:predicted LPLAT superfamily acyltransferase